MPKLDLKVPVLFVSTSRPIPCCEKPYGNFPRVTVISWLPYLASRPWYWHLNSLTLKETKDKKAFWAKKEPWAQTSRVFQNAWAFFFPSIICCLITGIIWEWFSPQPRSSAQSNGPKYFFEINKTLVSLTKRYNAVDVANSWCWLSFYGLHSYAKGSDIILT